jgi:hypothetical protein
METYCLYFIIAGRQCGCINIFFTNKDNLVIKTVLENNVHKPDSEATISKRLSGDSSIIMQQQKDGF